MNDKEIRNFMKKWKLTPTGAAFNLGVSLSTFHNVMGGKRLKQKTYDLMIEKKLSYEADRATLTKQNTTGLKKAS